MLYYGKGFTWAELYNIPVWLRKFYYKKLEETLKQEHSKASKINKSHKKISRPNIAPN